MDAAIVAAITDRLAGQTDPLLVGLCGAQGSGKSTIAARIAELLRERRLPTAVFSLDDFYLTHDERRRLAADVHPLLATRGVPGTHDMALLAETIDRLSGTADVAIPAFDKTIDDRSPPEDWPVVAPPVRVILFEGWCVGARPQPEAMLAAPVNALERDEDSDGRWRHFANAALAGPCRRLFDRIDLLFFLKAPGFEQVHAWRAEQEAKLERVPGHSRPPLDEAALARFIAHYERLTRWLLADEPADIVIDIDAHRQPLRIRPGSR